MKNKDHNESRRRSDRHKQTKKQSLIDKLKNIFTKEINNQEDHDETKVYQQENEEDIKNEINEIDQAKGFFTLKRITILLGSIFLLMLIGYTILLYGGKMFIDEKKLYLHSPTTIETEDGKVIWEIYDEYRLPVKLENIPNYVKEAFLSIEDKRFYEHSGVDVRSIGRALYRDVITRSKAEGGSTITQQLAKNLFLSNDKSWYRKVKEGMISLYLEREYSKDDILEMYLNAIYFGQGSYGIEAAANKYFNKSVEDLTLEEGALLAGMVKGPNGYSPIEHPEKAKERRNTVLQTMYNEGYITEEEMNQAMDTGVDLEVTERKQNNAYRSYVDLVIQEASEKYGLSIEDLKETKYKIQTGINLEAQLIAYEEFQNNEYFPGNNMEEVEGSFLMTNSSTGEIAAAIGGRDFEVSGYNRAIEPVGQPGSIMKPLAVYAPALETDDFTPYSMLEDELKEWDGKPVRNHDDVYEGQVSLYEALVQSKNTSSIWLLDKIGIKFAKDYLEKMGIYLEDNDLRIALGGLQNGITLKEMVQGYQTFSNDGKMIEAHAILTIEDYFQDETKVENYEEQTVFSEQVAWDMTEMLTDVVHRGTGSAGYYPKALAGKTGSTQHPKFEGQTKDAWFVGMTPEYVTAIWMGYDNTTKEGHSLHGGSSYPTMLTKAILSRLNDRQNLEETFQKPDNVDPLEEPIQLPIINNLQGKHVFGGWKITKGKLTWDKVEDDRVIYHIYEENEGEAKKIGEVTGDNEYIVDKASMFDSSYYYVVPYNPLTKEEGNTSNKVKITF